MKEKICSKCGLLKPIEEYKKDSKTKDGYRCWCKLCKICYNVYRGCRNHPLILYYGRYFFMSKINNLIGKKFGRLTVIKHCGSNKNRRALWLCQCDCGNVKIILGNSLLNNSTLSCGCYNKEHSKNIHTKHSLSYTKLYKVWQGMKTRCYNPNFIYYCNYGGRGITICNDWKNDFSKFYKWAIENGYKEGLTIDRINNDGNYEPSNCRWITRTEQNKNKRKPRKK